MNLPFRMPFAGESEVPSPDSILSHCSGALLPMFDTKEANTLRLLCREFKEAVAEFPWDDINTPIKGSLVRWRACFPNARGAKIEESEDGFEDRRTDDDVLHYLQNMRRLDISCCNSLTDAAFVHFKGIHTLRMIGCDQDEITDAAFVHLKGIHTLNMRGCDQSTITDAAFMHLKGIHALDMSSCSQDTITDAAFVHLAGICELKMNMCSQDTITGAACMHVKGVRVLSVLGCHQALIAAAAALQLEK